MPFLSQHCWLSGIINIMIYKSFFTRCTKGFTLIELMVALFIMSIATVLLLANYPDSTVRLNLLNNTHSLALQIREAQIRGSAVDSASSTAGGYGVFINSATSTQSILFSDSFSGLDIKNQAGLDIGDGLYKTSISPDKIVSTLKLKNTFTFKKLCVSSSTISNPILMAKAPHSFYCGSDYPYPISSLTISFMRPSQIAHIYINNSTTTDFASACIQIYSLKTPSPGHIRSVQVFHSGIITTTVTSCN